MPKINFYFSGFTTSNSEFDRINELFSGKLTLIRPDIFMDTKHAHPYLILENELPPNTQLNIISQSAGWCNGVILVKEYLNLQLNDIPTPLSLNKMVFISPGIKPVTRKEKAKIKLFNEANNYFWEELERDSLFNNTSLENLRRIANFVKTKKLAYRDLEDLSKINPAAITKIPTLVVHCLGDQYVSPSGIEQIRETPVLETETLEISSTWHNPLLMPKGELLVKKIESFLEK